MKITKQPPIEVIEHVKRMRVPADSSRRRCVDGGYKENEAIGAIAIPGADLGVSMALLSMKYPAKKAFNLVYNFLNVNNQPYCWHTDTHEGHDNCIIGCGHCNVAFENANNYNINPTEIKELLKIIRNKQKEGKGMEMIILDREHIEQGILIVISSNYSVMPWDQERNIQYFIYDKTRHESFLKDFVDFTISQGEKIDYNTLLNISTTQTNSTLGLLNSSKGKPMFSVDVSNDNPIITYLQDAPVIK